MNGSSAQTIPNDGRAECLPPQLESTSCPLCGKTTETPLIKKTGYRLVICRSCRLVYQNPRMTDEARRASWSGKPISSGKSFLEHYQSGEAWRLVLANKRLDRLADLGYGTGRILDIGCATGIFLHAARLRGFQAAGLDVMPNLTEFGRDHYGLDLRAGDILDTRFEGEPFDVITAFDVFGSLSHPLESLIKIRGMLKPDGLLWITASCANIGLWLFRESNPFNVYVTTGTMKKFLKKAGFGHYSARSVVKNSNMSELQGWERHLYPIPVVNSLFKKMVDALASPAQDRHPRTRCR